VSDLVDLGVLAHEGQGDPRVCADVDELEREAMAFGNEYARDAAMGKQPRPAAAFKLCGEL
jgi:hypothetical protein